MDSEKKTKKGRVSCWTFPDSVLSLACTLLSRFFYVYSSPTLLTLNLYVQVSMEIVFSGKFSSGLSRKILQTKVTMKNWTIVNGWSTKLAVMCWIIGTPISSHKDLHRTQIVFVLVPVGWTLWNMQNENGFDFSRNGIFLPRFSTRHIPLERSSFSITHSSRTTSGLCGATGWTWATVNHFAGYSLCHSRAVSRLVGVWICGVHFVLFPFWRVSLLSSLIP